MNMMIFTPPPFTTTTTTAASTIIIIITIATVSIYEIDIGICPTPIRIVLCERIIEDINDERYEI